MQSKAHPEMYSACCHTAFSHRKIEVQNRIVVLCVKKREIIQLCDEYSLAYLPLFVKCFYDTHGF